MSDDVSRNPEIRMSWTVLLSIGAAIVSIVSMDVSPAVARPSLIANAKEKGYPAKNCQYCHVSPLPKKDSFKPEDLNERGKFLLIEKDKHKAKDIDVDWLKDYPGGKEQK
jgi:hypothetical protein